MDETPSTVVPPVHSMHQCKFSISEDLLLSVKILIGRTVETLDKFSV